MVQQAIQDGIGDGGFTDDCMPVFDRALAGDDGGIFPIAVLDDFEQVVALGGAKGDADLFLDQVTEIAVCES